MRELLKYVDPSLHEPFIEEYNKIHNKGFLNSIELKELVLNEVSAVFSVDKESLIRSNSRGRSNEQISLASIAATYFLTRLNVNNTWAATQLGVDTSLVTYRINKYSNYMESDRFFQVHVRQVRLNLTHKYAHINW